ncbi:MAG: hypothetical protein AcusKO_30280 [Acuticoccus sp.]
MRFAVDVGGTFSDLVVEDGTGGFVSFKAPTTPADPIAGVEAALDLAAAHFGRTRRELLAAGEVFIHATTRALNAVLTGTTARTAFLTTEGHPDILLFREGGRSDLFDYTRPFNGPYVPRALTFEVPGRIWSDGREMAPLDLARLDAITDRLAAVEVEAVGVCLLWSVINPAHELAVAERIAARLPDVALTLSHQLNPILREYRRASSTCIDASLKPVMGPYLSALDASLRGSGFAGRILGVTSQGGVVDTAALADAPIHALNSGPALAPISGRRFAAADADAHTAIVTDSGGTSFDVTLVRAGEIPRTAEAWIGPEFNGHIVGFPAVEVSWIGAGGGSIASVDAGGLLSVGPQSAGADPGPVCYDRGGDRPTVTDAALVLGYLHPGSFLGGRLALDDAAARAAIVRDVAAPLGLSAEDAAAAIFAVATERMVAAIEDVTVNRGIDPTSAVMVAGGGSAGFTAVAIARRLGAGKVVVPTVGATLSAAGALMSDLTAEFRSVVPATSEAFDGPAIAAALAVLDARCRAFAAEQGAADADVTVRHVVEARYLAQAWDIEIELPALAPTEEGFAAALARRFHAKHREMFAVDDPTCAIEFLTWTARVACRLRGEGTLPRIPAASRAAGRRRAYFAGAGWVDARLADFSADAGAIAGPAIVESAFTTVVVPPGARAEVSAAGSLLITPGA